MEPYEQRVIEEKAQLDEHLTKLYAFLNDEDKVMPLPEEEVADLFDQMSQMEALSETLGRRIRRFGGDATPTPVSITVNLRAAINRGLRELIEPPRTANKSRVDRPMTASDVAMLVDRLQEITSTRNPKLI